MKRVLQMRMDPNIQPLLTKKCLHLCTQKLMNHRSPTPPTMEPPRLETPIFYRVPRWSHVDGESYHQTCQYSNTFNILYYNCRSLLPKIDYLRAVTFSDHPDVICLVETWLSPDILDNELYIKKFKNIKNVKG